MISVELANRQSLHQIEEARLIDVARSVLLGEKVHDAELSIAVVDSTTMHALNLEYLNHDYPTDVLSFPLGETGGTLLGEVIVCADVAADVAARYEWSVMDELLLYLIHGTLHLVGFDDKSEATREEMRQRERHYLKLNEIRASNDSEVTLSRFATAQHAPRE